MKLVEGIVGKEGKITESEREYSGYLKDKKLKLEVQNGSEIVEYARKQFEESRGTLADALIRMATLDDNIKDKVVIPESQWNEFVAWLQSEINDFPKPNNYPMSNCMQDAMWDWMQDFKKKILGALG